MRKSKLIEQHRQVVTEYEADLNAVQGRLDIANAKGAETLEHVKQAKALLESAWQILHARTENDDPAE